MPGFQTLGEPTFPYQNVTWEKDKPCLKLQDGHRAHANEVNMMLFSKQQDQGKGKKKKTFKIL